MLALFFILHSLHSPSDHAQSLNLVSSTPEDIRNTLDHSSAHTISPHLSFECSHDITTVLTLYHHKMLALFFILHSLHSPSDHTQSLNLVSSTPEDIRNTLDHSSAHTISHLSFECSHDITIVLTLYHHISHSLQTRLL